MKYITHMLIKDGILFINTQKVPLAVNFLPHIEKLKTTKSLFSFSNESRNKEPKTSKLQTAKDYAMSSFNGYPSWNAWNVALWLNNTQLDYHTACECYNDALSDSSSKTGILESMLESMVDIYEGEKTPDGAKFTKTSLKVFCREFINDNFPNKVNHYC